ncbi:AAEL002054-PA [Aedes aegypti]|uniref:AAEL002054-PA n=1 Tax=Aedes aegypti TaxID=7159 RepID=Q17JB8_AEDAE|nr:AAEL002054-PA [Aedes aegypti]
MAHQSLEWKLSYYNDPEYASVRHAQSGRLFNWVKVSHGFKKFRLRRWNSTGSWSPEPSGIIDLTNFHVAEGNYTKRKNVFKLTTVGGYPNPHLQQQHHHPHQLHPFAMMGGGGPTAAQSHQHLAVHHTQSAGLSSVGPSSGSPSLYKGYERELLLQADSHNDMRLWMDSLRTVCRSSQYLNSSVSTRGIWEEGGLCCSSGRGLLEALSMIGDVLDSDFMAALSDRR